MSSHQVKNQVRDQFEAGFDTLHRIADVVTFPLAPIDGAIHGTARGILNWLTDTHPGQSRNTNASHSFWPPQQQQQQQQQQQYPQYGGNYGYPNNSPPSPPSYGGQYGGPYWQGPGQGQPSSLPYYGRQGIQNVEDGNNNNSNHNNGAIKVGNYGGA